MNSEARHDTSSPASTRKRKKERHRVTRACDRCKRRKVRCDGSQPCSICLAAKTECKFESTYTRGKAPIPGPPEAVPADSVVSDSRINARVSVAGRDDLVTPQSSDAPTTKRLRRTSTVTQTAVQEQADEPVSDNRNGETTSLEPSLPDESLEPSQTDLQGHYIGPASGVSFLLRVQKRLHNSVSFSPSATIFTFGDAPFSMPEFEPSFCMMLPRDDAQQLLSRYFDFAMPTYRFLHQPTIQAWFDEFYDTMGTMNDQQSAPARIALIFMVLAHGRVYMPEDKRPGPEELSIRYFLAAKHQLENERGSICLTSVQARLTQCYYLLTQSRINHCWSLFGTVSHLALAIGLNRHRRPGANSGISVLEAEGRRRTFWCAYTLDAYLSVSLGRPRTFHDEDIDAELPACVDDESIEQDAINRNTNHDAPSLMLAPIAHIKLARIMSKILRDLYGIKPISSGRRAMITERVSKELSDWYVELAHFLDADGPGWSSMLTVPIFRRQRNVLNLTYWHSIILTYRPYVLKNLAHLTRRSDSAEQTADPHLQESVNQCLAAAMNTAKTIDEIASGSQFFRAFWITAYFAFTATIVLYIYVIQKRASPSEVWSTYFIAAARCQSHISLIAEEGSLSQRYCLVLEELRVEALRQIKRSNPTVKLNGMDGRVQQGEQHLQEQQRQQQQHAPLGSTQALGIANWPGPPGIDQNMMGIFDESPSAATDYTNLLVENSNDQTASLAGFPPNLYNMDYPSGWDQFANMIFDGLGNMDGFLQEPH